MARVPKYLKLSLGVGSAIGLLLIILFGYLWLQMLYNLPEYYTTINMIYGIVGGVLWAVSMVAFFMDHYFTGMTLAVWGVGLLWIVINFYLWTL